MSILYAFNIVTEDCICHLWNTARCLSTANNLLEFFVHAFFFPLIVEHDVSFIISVSGSEIS